MTDLPDVNVWLALVDENHPHHPKARGYWQYQSSEEIVFCRITALGFLRLSTHPKVLSRPLTSHEAWEIHERYYFEANVGFLPDAKEVDIQFMEISRTTDFQHHLWTDCYLAALANFHQCRLISFDSDFKRFQNLNLLLL